MFQAGAGADEVGHEIVGGLPQDTFRGVVLHDAGAFVEDGNPVAQLGGLVKVVGDAHNGFAELGLDIDELVLEALAGDRVDGAEGFVHEEHRRVGGQGAGHADALLLTAREFLRVAVPIGFRVQGNHGEKFIYPLSNAGLVPLQHFRHDGNVGAHREVR